MSFTNRMVHAAWLAAIAGASACSARTDEVERHGSAAGGSGSGRGGAAGAASSSVGLGGTGQAGAGVASGGSGGRAGGAGNGGGAPGGSAGVDASGGAMSGVAGADGGEPGAGEGGEAGDGGITGFPSCAGMTGNECSGGDCCASLPVPAGTITYYGRPVVVPSFYLDKYEVTVARFRAFQQAVSAWHAAGNPVAGAGAHPDVAESGWRPEWLDDPYLDDHAVSEGFSPLFGLDAVYDVEGSDWLAVNQMPWHIAFAFCIWDGGRLPADVEWVYAAYRGSEQTDFAWGDTPPLAEMFDSAVLDSLVSVVPEAEGDIFGNAYPFWRDVSVPVGSHPPSAGKFGQLDLNSGLWELTRDTGVAVAPADFIRLSGDDDLANQHLIRGGSWDIPSGALNRTREPAPNDRIEPVLFNSNDGKATGGFRCARDG